MQLSGPRFERDQSVQKIAPVGVVDTCLFGVLGAGCGHTGANTIMKSETERGRRAARNESAFRLCASVTLRAKLSSAPAVSKWSAQ